MFSFHRSLRNPLKLGPWTKKRSRRLLCRLLFNDESACGIPMKKDLSMLCAISSLILFRRHEDFLRKVPILSGLMDYERMTIADALQTKYFTAGEEIITEGSKGETFYIIESGEVMCTKKGVDNEVSPRLSRGDYFGELALISNSLRAATVTAVTDVKCQALDRHTFKRLLGPLQRTFKRNMETYEG